MKRLLTFFIAFGTILSTVSMNISNTSAQTAVQRNLYKQGIYYYDHEIDKCIDNAGSIELVPGENQKAAFLYFIGRGLSPDQSAAIVGNLIAESQVNPAAIEGAPNELTVKPGFGIAQWSDTKTRDGRVASTRRTQIEQYAAKTGATLTDLKFQLDYLYDQELVGTPYYKRQVYDPIKASTTLRQASDIFLIKFEVAAGKDTEAKQSQRAALGQKVLDLYGSDAGVVGPALSSGACGSTAGAGSGIVAGFPLQTNKALMELLNGPSFKLGVMESGHNYAAYDIMAPTGTPVVSILDGTVVQRALDRCPGTYLAIYNKELDVTVSYMHMAAASVKLGKDATVKAGDVIGQVGTTSEGCVAPHLHIDAVSGNRRIGCSRLGCPEANARKFVEGGNKINLPKALYDGYMALK